MGEWSVSVKTFLFEIPSNTVHYALPWAFGTSLGMRLTVLVV